LGLTVDGELVLEELYGLAAIHRTVAPERLPRGLRGLIGERLQAVSQTGARGCEVVVSKVVVGALLTDSDSGYHALFEAEEYDDEGNAVRTIPDQERFAKSIEGQRVELMIALADTDGQAFDGCEVDGFVAHHVTRLTGTPLSEDAADGALSARALAAFRDHGFWEIQQVGYQRSVEALRKQAREEYETEVANAKADGASKADIDEIHRDERADHAPPDWVTAEGVEDTTSEPEVVAWKDGAGRVRFVRATLGNDVSCAAPRAWMFFRVDRDELVVLDFGHAGSPVGIVEYPDGRTEVLFGTWDKKSIRHLDGDQLTVQRAFALSNALHCSYGQIPPLSATGSRVSTD